MCAEGFTLLVLVCRRVRIFRTRVAQAREGSIFLPGDQENLMFEKCVFLTWSEITKTRFLVAGRYNWFRRPWGARGFNFSVVSAAGCQTVRTLQRNGEQTVNPPARGWPRRRRVHMFRRRASEKFACFVLMRWRVHIFRPRAPKGSHFVLGARRVHVFRPRVREGSCFSSSGAEGFACVLGRRRVHIFGS